MKTAGSRSLLSTAACSPSRRTNARSAALRAGLLAASSAAALLVAGHSANAGPGPGQTVTGTTPSVSNNASITSIQILGPGGTVTGAVTNTGTIAGIPNGNTAIGIKFAGGGASIGGGINNTGTINVNQGNGQNAAVGILINPSSLNPKGTVSGGISNSGTISASGAGPATGLQVALGAVINGGITNNQMITASSTNGQAIGVLITSLSVVNSGANGGINNSGTIQATGKTLGTSIIIQANAIVNGGMTNTGTITGSNAAVDFSHATTALTFNQAGGSLNGSVNLSRNGDTFNFTGGTLNGGLIDNLSGTATVNVTGTGTATLSSTASIFSIKAFNHLAGATLVFQVTPTQAPTINANNITLAGNFTVTTSGFTAGQKVSFQNVIVATLALNNSVTVVQPTGATIALTPDAANPAKALDLTVTQNAAVSPPPPPNIPNTPNTPSTPANTPAAGGNGGTAVTVLPPGTFAAAATTPNQKAVANAVQALGKGTLFNAVSNQPIANAPQVFNALSGEVHASTVNAAFTDATLPNTAILDRLNQPVAPPVLGAARETTGAYAADLPTRKGTVAPVSANFYQPRVFDFWGEGFGDWGRVSSDGNAASLSRTTGGFVLGGDVSASNVFGGDWRFGLAGGYTNDQITVNQRGSSSTFESVFGGAYAGASFGAFQLRAGALYGTNSTSTTRQVAFPGFFEALSSSNGGYTAQAFGEAGYRIQLGGLGFGGGSRTFIEPFAGGAAFLIHQNGFTEVGGASALVVSARDFNIQTTTLGVRGELGFGSMPLTVKTMLGWRHAYGDVVPSVLLTFQGGAQAFSSSGVPIDRDAFVAEAGIDYSLTSLLSVGVSYSGQYGQRATDNAVKGNVNLRF